MMKLKSLAIAALSSAFFIACAHAQGVGQLAPGQVWGNNGAVQAPASPVYLYAPFSATGVFINSAPYNAKCDGATDDTAAIQMAINAQPASRGYVGIPPNSNCAWAGVLDFKGHNNLTLAGVGSGFGSAATNSSRLTYTGPNVPRAMDGRDTNNNTFVGLSIVNTTPAMTGYLIDCGGTNPGTTLSTGCTVKDSSMFGGNGAGVAAGCLNISESQLATIDHVWFQRCQPAIHGQNILGQNTTARIQNSTFTLHTGAAISECGEGWTLFNDTWEPDVNGRANGFANSLAAPCKGIEIINPWMGDVTTVAGGTWITLTAQGGTISGGRISVGPAAAASNAVSLLGGTGYNLTGTIYENFNLAIACTTSPTAGRVNGNTFTGVATQVQSGCVNFNTDNNSPDISSAGVATMTAAGVAADADTFSTNQSSGNTVKQTLAAIKTWIKGWIVKGDVGLGNVNNVVQVATVKKQAFTASGTYTPSAGMLYAIIECIGGGGGGGAAVGTASQTYSGGGGGSGGYSRAIVSAASVGASKTVTIGGGGIGGAPGANNGTAGSDTSVGALCVGKGGSGGLFGSASQSGMGGLGGVAGTGDLTPIGNQGGAGVYISIAGNLFLATNFGGSSSFGAGAVPPTPAGGTVVGNAASANTGGGGSGGFANNVAANIGGGNGGSGIVFITEYNSQ